MPRRLSSLFLLPLVLITVLLTTRGVASAQTNPLLVPISQTITDATGTTIGTLTGTLNITKFTVQNGSLAAVGKLTGTVTSTTGQVLNRVKNFAVTLPVANIS